MTIVYDWKLYYRIVSMRFVLNEEANSLWKLIV